MSVNCCQAFSFAAAFQSQAASVFTKLGNRKAVDKWKKKITTQTKANLPRVLFGVGDIY